MLVLNLEGLRGRRRGDLPERKAPEVTARVPTVRPEKMSRDGVCMLDKLMGFAVGE